MLQAQGSPLVQGAAAGQRTQRVRVLRAFLLGGQRQEIGTELDIPQSLAADLFYRRAAEPVQPTVQHGEDQPPAAPAAKKAIVRQRTIAKE